ncbi:MAG: NUDIX hydrolase [Alphaproteobacteria bacterium]|nr:NUDIX hydrolase [Alphaproteobacteria bacterium]
MRRFRPLADHAARAALWTAYRLLRVWWWLRRPYHRGAVVAIWLGPQILMVQHSYRRPLSWPGGGVRPGERAVAAAVRELREELALDVPAAALTFVGDLMERYEARYDHVHIFELRLARPPVLKPDGREVIAARFMTPQAALARPLVPFIARYLEERVRITAG